MSGGTGQDASERVLDQLAAWLEAEMVERDAPTSYHEYRDGQLDALSDALCELMRLRGKK